MLLKYSQQREISEQRRMPVDDVATDSLTQVTGEVVQFYYYNAGVKTIDAGQAAGTVVVAKLVNRNIKNGLGDVIGSLNDTSFSFVTGTILTTMVQFPYYEAERYDTSIASDKANAITSGFTNGQYCIDHRTGTIYGKKATNGVSDTASYLVETSVSGGSSTLPSSVNISKVGGTDVGAANTARTTATKVIPVQPIDEQGNIIKGGGSSINAQYLSPADFTVTYTSASTVTLSGVPFTIATGASIVYVKVRNSSTNITTTYVNGSAGYAFAHSGGVVTAYLNGSVASIFTSNDMYEMGINGQEKAFDPSTNSRMTTPLVNLWNQYTDVETLVTAQDLTASYADFGAEIDMRGFDTLGIYIITDVNNSENVNLKVLAKHTSAGTDEYELETGGTKALWTTGASDAKIYYEFATDGIPFVQLQAIAGTVGATAGDLTISIIKMKK